MILLKLGGIFSQLSPLRKTKTDATFLSWRLTLALFMTQGNMDTAFAGMPLNVLLG